MIIMILFAWTLLILPLPAFVLSFYFSFPSVLFGNIGTAGSVKKQEQCFSAPANPDQRRISIKGRVTHVCLLRIFRFIPA